MIDQKPQEKDIAVILAATATKASGSTLGYEIGRERGTDSLHLRIVSNAGGGTFTKAWQPIAVLRSALSPYKAQHKGLRFSEALGPAIPQKGRNNAPFVGYVLAAIGILAGNAEKPGEYTVAAEWEPWVERMLALPVPPAPPPAPIDVPAKAPAAGPDPVPTVSGSKATGKKAKASATPSPKPAAAAPSTTGKEEA